MSHEQTSRRGIPDATVSRLPVYLRTLLGMAEQGVAGVSSEGLALAAGVTPAKLRKDLSYLGSHGVRGVGYDVAHLIDEISMLLGLSEQWPVAIVGVGNLGHALAGYGGFATRGFRVAALFDDDPQLVGQVVSGLRVRPMSEIAATIASEAVSIGVVATPAEPAQAVCDQLVAAGVRSVLNFAPCVLVVPPGVDVRKVDLSTELQILAFHEQRRLRAVTEHEGDEPMGLAEVAR